jgi:hypothetical protein
MRKENIITVKIDAQTASSVGTETLDAGNVIGVIVFSSSPSNNHNNTGMVRTEILVNNSPVAKNQPIDNLRSRNVPFNEDGKPLEDIGGKTVVVKVTATENFSADTEFDFVFIYGN